MRPVDESFRIGEVTFVWNTHNALGNLRKHGVAFVEAVEAFFDPFLVFLGAEVADAEVWETMIGLTRSWRMLVVVYTYRASAIRIISARDTTNAERTRYEEQ